MATGLQHSHPREQPEDSVQEYGWPRQPCAAGHQRHAQKGLHLYLNPPLLLKTQKCQYICVFSFNDLLSWSFQVFGAFSSDPFRVSKYCYGTGETFLYSFNHDFQVRVEWFFATYSLVTKSCLAANKTKENLTALGLSTSFLCFTFGVFPGIQVERRELLLCERQLEISADWWRRVSYMVIDFPCKI